MNNLFGYSLFTEVPEPLRSYNRMRTVFNIRETHGKALCADYINKFSEHDKLKVGAMIVAVRQKGMKQIRDEVMNA